MDKPTQEQEQAMRAWAHTPEVRVAIREGVKALKEGRIRPWSEVEKDLGLEDD